MIILKIENPALSDPGPLYVKSLGDLHDLLEDLSMFICLPGEEQYLKAGPQLVITAVEMPEEEFNQLPIWPYA